MRGGADVSSASPSFLEPHRENMVAARGLKISNASVLCEERVNKAMCIRSSKGSREVGKNVEHSWDGVEKRWMEEGWTTRLRHCQVNRSC